MMTKTYFTGKDDPFMFIDGKPVSRKEAEEICDMLVKAGMDSTKKVCRLIRTVLRNQKPEIECVSVKV